MAYLFGRALPPVGAGVAFLALVVLAAWAAARHSPDKLPAVAWAGLSAVAAFLLAEVVASALAQPRPHSSFPKALVLVNGLHGYAFPDARTAACGAVVCCLALARRWLTTLISLVVTAVVGLAGVYVGVDYPSDVAGGAIFGAAVALVLWPVASRALAAVLAGMASTPARPLVESRSAAKAQGTPLKRPFRPEQMPNARAMEALRAASEAARSHRSHGGDSVGRHR